MKIFLIALLLGNILLYAQEKLVKDYEISFPKVMCKRNHGGSKMIWDDVEKKCYVAKIISDKNSLDNNSKKKSMKEKANSMC